MIILRKVKPVLVCMLVGCGSGQGSNESKPSRPSAQSSVARVEQPVPRTEPAREVRTQSLGIELPPNTTLTSDGSSVGGEGVSEVCEFLESPLAVEEVTAFFARNHGSEASTHFVAANSTEVTVQDARSIPRNCYGGDEVAAAASEGSKSWIITLRHGGPTPCPTCPRDSPARCCPAATAPVGDRN